MASNVDFKAVASMQELDDGPPRSQLRSGTTSGTVQRIAKSRSFSSAHTLRAFLLYVGEHALAGGWTPSKSSKLEAACSGVNRIMIRPKTISSASGPANCGSG